MSVAHDALLEGIAIANDTLRGVFMPEDLVMTLLRADADANLYETVLTLEDGWFFEYSATRQAFRFEIARDDAAITEAMGLATHIAVHNDVYRIADGDTLPPIGTDVTWKIFAERFDTADAYAVMR
jgi:hypothetical protein